MAARKVQSRIVLHSSMTNMYWVMITIAVNGILVIFYEFWSMWRAGSWESHAGPAACVVAVFVAMILYC
jgi:hypothetical protein